MWNYIRDRLVGTGEKSPLGILMTVPLNKAAHSSRRWNSFENKNTAELVASFHMQYNVIWYYIYTDFAGAVIVVKFLIPA